MDHWHCDSFGINPNWRLIVYCLSLFLLKQYNINYFGWPLDKKVRWLNKANVFPLEIIQKSINGHYMILQTCLLLVIMWQFMRLETQLTVGTGHATVFSSTSYIGPELG